MQERGSFHILLVEDQLVLASVEETQLKGFGYRVMHATSGEEALSLLAEGSGIFDLIVMDVELGRGKDGIETAKEILSRRKIPIIFSTSHTDLETIERMEKTSPYGYVIKNAGIFVLEASIKMALRLFEANAKLQGQSEAIKDFYNNAPCGYHSLDRNGKFLIVNDTELHWLGYTREELVGKVNFGELVATGWGEVFRRTFPEGKKPESVSNLDLRLTRKDGSTFPVLVSRNWIFDEGGEIVMSRSTLIDNTLQKEAEARVASLLKEKNLILREVHHRVKNNMNSVVSLLALKSDTCEEPLTKKVLTEAISQVESMGYLYERLYQSEVKGDVELAAYLPGLIGEMLRIFGRGDSIRVVSDIAATRLDAGRLSALNIIINELITNSVKYAFDGVSDPLISVTAKLVGTSLSIVYEDNGKGLPENFSVGGSDGFGMTLMEGLASQLGGSIGAKKAPRGARFVLEFPI